VGRVLGLAGDVRKRTHTVHHVLGWDQTHTPPCKRTQRQLEGTWSGPLRKKVERWKTKGRRANGSSTLVYVVLALWCSFIKYKGPIANDRRLSQQTVSTASLRHCPVSWRKLAPNLLHRQKYELEWQLMQAVLHDVWTEIKKDHAPEPAYYQAAPPDSSTATCSPVNTSIRLD